MAETLGVVLAAAGVGLVYAAFTNQNPIAELRSALSTGSTAGRVPIATAPTSTGGELGGDPAGVLPGSWPNDPPNLVQIGQGSHRLAKPAADAFARWRQQFGKAITITDSYRSVAQQAADHARDPDRFAAPGHSAHGEGRAVDVNLQAVGARPSGARPSDWLRDPVYKLLVQAANATGWCNYQVAKNSTDGKMAEPWHFSYGVCK